jgi:hypothetical protein
MTMASATPNDKTENEIAKQALSDYIAGIRHKMLLCRHHYDITVKDDNTRIKVSVSGTIPNIGTKRNWRGLIWDKSISKYSVKIEASQEENYIYIGFASSKLYDSRGYYDGSGFYSCGWYLEIFNGHLHSKDGDRLKTYDSGCKVGDTITCIYNCSSSEISFEKNGVSLGVAFTNVKGEDIAPAVELYYEGDSITLSAISNRC